MTEDLENLGRAIADGFAKRDLSQTADLAEVSQDDPQEPNMIPTLFNDVLDGGMVLCGFRRDDEAGPCSYPLMIDTTVLASTITTMRTWLLHNGTLPPLRLIQLAVRCLNGHEVWWSAAKAPPTLLSEARTGYSKHRRPPPPARSTYDVAERIREHTSGTEEERTFRKRAWATRGIVLHPETQRNRLPAGQRE